MRSIDVIVAPSPHDMGIVHQQLVDRDLPIWSASFGDFSVRWSYITISCRVDRPRRWSHDCGLRESPLVADVQETVQERGERNLNRPSLRFNLASFAVFDQKCHRRDWFRAAQDCWNFGVFKGSRDVP